MLKNIKDQLREERRKNEALTAALNRTNANLEYVAMMTGTELDEPESEVEGGEEE